MSFDCVLRNKHQELSLVSAVEARTFRDLIRVLAHKLLHVIELLLGQHEFVFQQFHFAVEGNEVVRCLKHGFGKGFNRVISLEIIL